MKKAFAFFLMANILVLFAGCCSVNTKLIERERVDQQMSGNRGYLMGTPPPLGERRPTKKYYETQIEINPIGGHKTERKDEKTTANVTSINKPMQNVTSVNKPMQEEETDITEIEITEEEEYSTYKVQKNETLQKISLKLFGTTKKWENIYEANKDTLKSPDKICPGMVIKIPMADKIMVGKTEFIK